MPGPRGRAFPRPDGLTLAIVAIALLGVGLVLAREAVQGVALHLDSVEYIGTARNLLAGDGFVRLNGHVYDAWAPLYPLLLAAASFGAFDPLDVAGPLNAVAFGLTVCVVGHWMRRRLSSRLLVVWACLAVALAVPLSRAASAALSEAPFILLATLALFHADAFLRDGGRGALAWAAAFTALACLMRYLGLPLIPAIALLLLARGGGPLHGRARLALGWALAAAIPLALWMLRNVIATETSASGGTIVERLWMLRNAISTETFTGGHPGSSFAGVARRGIEDMSRWWIPDLAPEWMGGIALVLTGAFLAALTLIALAGFRREPRAPAWFGTVHLLAVLAVVYVLAVWASILGLHIQGSLRYHLPVYVPIVVMAAVACDQLLRFPRARMPGVRIGSVPLLSAGILLVMSLWIAYQVPGLAREMRREHPLDADMAARWADAALLQPLRELPPGESLLSNAPHLLRAHLDARGDYRMLDREYAAAVASIEAAPPGTRVVWFHLWAGNLRFAYGAPELRGLPGLEAAVERRDGIVFRATGDGANVWRDLARVLAGETPAASAFFPVYLVDGALVYDRSPCAPADTRMPVFLHVVPADTDDLPADRRAYGFDSLDFRFSDSGARFDGRCMARAELPDYDIARVRTGQFSNAGVRWQVEVPLGERR